MSEEMRKVENAQELNLQVEGLSEKEVKEVQKIFHRFLKKYEENPEADTRKWLFEQLKEELPEKKKKNYRRLQKRLQQP